MNKVKDSSLIARLRERFHARDEHHPNCASRGGICGCPAQPCDCYAKQSAEAHEVLDEILRRLNAKGASQP